MPIVSHNIKSHRNLSVGDKVEVKSLEEGFLGSWHVGEVIEKRKGLRVVKYDHCLNAEETDNLVERIEVSSRGHSRLRPCPPFGEIERDKICYGLCVDAYYNDAWWEGVIFNSNDGSESRKVFFPDLGDEMEMEIKDLRMTHDWDQLTDHWKVRGKWLFLEVIEEHRGYNLIPSSIKQMWYDLREGLGETADWACPNIKSLWKNLVDDIISSHRSLTLDAFMSAYEFSKDVLEDHKDSSFHSKAGASSEGIDPQNDDLVTGNEECELVIDGKAENSASALDLSNDSSATLSDSDVRPYKKCTLNKKFVADSGSADADSGSVNADSGSTDGSTDADSGSSDADCGLIDADPGLIDAYLLTKRPGVEMTNNVRNYLYRLGWEFFPQKFPGRGRTQYKSPDGRIFMNLRSACESLKPTALNCYPKSDPNKKHTPNKIFNPDHGLIDAYLVTKHPGLEMTNNVRNYLYHLGWKSFSKDDGRQVRTRYKSPDGRSFHDLRLACKSLKSAALDSYPNADDGAHKPKFPEYVCEYLEGMKNSSFSSSNRAKELRGKIKAYLSEMGWKFKPIERADGKLELHYKSPVTSRTYSSVLRVCQAIDKGLESNTASKALPNTTSHCGGELLSSNADAQHQVSPCSECNELWIGADPGLIDADPRSIDAYLLTKRPGDEMTNNVRSYLYHLGWKSFSKKVGKQVRTRYKSPNGRIFHDLRSVCESLKSIALNSYPKFEDSAHKQIPSFVREYLEGTENNSFRKSVRFEKLRGKIKGYLAERGWRFLYVKKKVGGFETRYKSPDTSKVYNTLLKVCQAIARGSEPNTMAHSDDEPSLSNADARLLISPCSEEDSLLRKHSTENPCKTNNSLVCYVVSPLVIAEEDQPHEPLDSVGEPLSNADAHHIVSSCSEKDSLLRKLSTEKPGEMKNSSACDVISPPVIAEEDQLHECCDELENAVNTFSSRKSKSRKLDGHGGTRVNRSRKRVREGCPSSFSQVPRTVLSWLIDNNVISSRKKVYYRNRKDLPSIGEGRITRLGIKCSCCNKVFLLSSFAAHVGSNSCQPEANLFLEDERSLLDCQMELVSKNSWLMSEGPLKVESGCGSQSESWSDDICSICHYGGDLILCELCPSAFHKDCLHLPEIPDGDWSCPSCCCGICGGSQFDVNSEQFTDISVLCCEQCERQYHAHCIRNREMVNLDARPTDKWFCCKPCEKIHWGLQQLVGKPILVGHNNLTWTMLKPIHYSNSDDFDIVTMARTNSKLLVSLGVMDECFEPVKEPQTRRDIVEDVILCRRCELKRLNFGGFFTILLERDDELISAALLRVYGDKVAEIPLIGTRFQHRRLGMCRILMNEIEKNLINLGVEKLVLPAAASVLNTWTTAFGFSSLTQSERSELLCYTFLDFQDTVMCQKPLKKRPSPLSNSVKDKRDVHFESRQNAEDGTVLLDSEGNSSVSEVFQEERTEGSNSVNQAAQVNDSGEKCSANGGDRGLGSSAPTITDQAINKAIRTCSTTEISGKKRVNTGSENGDRYLLFYKRRKTRVPTSSSAHQVNYPKVEVICR